ncbi:MAG TPA: site-2 protease family protein [Vicinamibacterales bacterium]|nr:site-2 protease family protein [Vicinamibacterales bacterium]
MNALSSIDFAQVFILFVVLLFSLTVHEAAHAWTADTLGDPTARVLGRVSLNPIVHVDPIGTILFPLLAIVAGVPLIGWAKPVPVNVTKLRHHRRDYVLVAAAGPASNLAIAVVAAIALKLIPVSPVISGEANVTVPIASMLSRALYINVLLAVFNMIPIPPLDGGNVIGGLLPRPLAYRFDSLIRPYGFILLYALMLTRGLDYLIGRPSSLLLSWLQ